MLTVAATYVYFLLYAQFGFLFLLQSRAFPVAVTDAALGSMGLAGVVASFATPAALRRWGLGRMLRTGFALAGAAAMAAPLGRTAPPVILCAASIGGGVGLVTVSLAARLGKLVPPSTLGRRVGLGTALAYLICNQPPLFAGSITVHTAVAVVACLLGGWASDGLTEREPSTGPVRPCAPPVGFAFPFLVGAFALLIGLDSTAFAVIQRSEGLLAKTWGDAAHQLTQGAVHALAALAAGWLLDRGWRRLPLVLAGACFLVSLPDLALDRSHLWAGPLYAVGVSFYSVALVAAPSLWSDQRRAGADRRAAILYAAAGWIASGLGVGLAQRLTGIPPLALWLFGGALALTLTFAGPALRLQTSHWGVLGLTLAAWAGLRPSVAHWPHDVTPEQRGRRVYIEEGCLHCHSQYVRPRPEVFDALWWGPATPLDRTQRPPLVGNRRQGPDLLQVGLRRSPEWLRAHFEMPTVVRPGSRMPSYAHLFAPGETRGEDLLAYLLSLGRGRESARAATLAAWRPPDLHPLANPERGGRLFTALCSGCHGPEGWGNGPAADRFPRPALQLRRGTFLYAPFPAGTPARREALSRWIRFGIPGTGMAGWEFLSDRDLADLVAWLDSLAP
jgi:cytochrome c oxidase cbb3-type subunit 2